MAGDFAVELERVVKAPRAIVWAVVADTNRWDRAAGLAPPKYRWTVEDGRRLRIADAKELGFELQWIEPPYRWVEGRLVEGERRFTKGPIQGGGFDVRLEDAPGGGTRVTTRAWVRGPWLLGLIQRAKFARALPRYLDSIESMLAAEGAKALAYDANEPAVVQAQRLGTASFDPIASGPRSEVDEVQLDRRVAKLRSTRTSPELVDKLVKTLRETPDADVAMLRPFEHARRWDHDRRDVLRAFLHATEAGLLDLRWQINCPVCRVGASNAGKLADIATTAHCDACDIDYGVDFARHVEAVFSPNPSVRRAFPTLYCASSPAFLPHVLAQLAIAPKATKEVAVDVTTGTLHLRTLHVRRTADVEIASLPCELRVTIGDGTLDVSVAPTDGPASKLRIENTTSAEVTLLAERSAWSADAALGSAVATFPEFVRLFATDAPASGVELAIGEVALLFSDLTGSTALYERVGDARAFAMVEEHFRLMQSAVEANGGVVIKTMGDAVMASFPTLRESVEAALAMVRDHDRAFRAHDLAIKIGIHIGPALVIRANERFDYFGTTVNVAARLQAQAASGELVLQAEAARDPSVAPLLTGLAVREFTAKLKGIAEDQKLLGFDVSGAHADD